MSEKQECHFTPRGEMLCPAHWRERYGEPHARPEATFRGLCSECERLEQLGSAATGAYELDADLPDLDDTQEEEPWTTT